MLIYFFIGLSLWILTAKYRLAEINEVTNIVLERHQYEDIGEYPNFIYFMTLCISLFLWIVLYPVTIIRKIKKRLKK